MSVPDAGGSGESVLPERDRAGGEPARSGSNDRAVDDPSATENPGAGAEDPAAIDCTVDGPLPFGCGCEVGDECASGFCLMGQQGKVCTQACLEDCPSGWTCSVLVGTCPDCAQVCIPRDVTLCSPCQTNADCRNPYFAEGVGARCLVHGDAGAFCGIGCAVDEDCPAGYGCQLSAGIDGSSSLQCVPDDGVCACTAFAVDQGAVTTCSISNSSGACKGIRTCSSGSLSACSASIPADEECDGLDNDCDGLYDEATCGVGATCACNELGCACGCAPGTVDCGSGCVDVATSIAHCGDCGAECVGDAVGAFVCNDGVCAIAKCAAGFEDADGDVANGCECPVGEEVCDGLDNDCDGQIDEGDDLCSGVGGCAGVCSEGSCSCEGGCDACGGTCVPFESYQTDTDNCGYCGQACDLVNAALHKCDAGVCTSILCADGFKDCNADPTDGCEWTVAKESCDLIDNDCDGMTDEAPVVDCAGQQWPGVLQYGCDLGVCTIAACEQSAVDVNGNPFDGCECTKTSNTEICDGIDNDCDGQVDEGPLSDCGGNKVCTGGVCLCDPSQPFLQSCGEQACSDVSSSGAHCGFCGNDCSALGLQNVAQAACVQGDCKAQVCAPGFVDANGEAFDGCECEKTSTKEICDLVDNDCDGIVDELPNDCAGGKVCSLGSCVCPSDQPWLQDCGTGSCVDTSQTPQHCGFCGHACQLPGVAVAGCEAGACVPSVCEPGRKDCNGDPADGCEWEIQPETCNGIDDDCDGQVDEQVSGVNQACSSPFPGVCAQGQTVCSGGQITCQPLVQPFSKAEVCNGIDDDCDGVPDNGDPGGGAACTVPGAMGACAQGTRHCVAGTLVCEQSTWPQAELCDGQDNDCNGAVDGMQQGCSSECGGGTQTCSFGQWLPCTAKQPKGCTNWNTCSTQSMCVDFCPAKPAETCDGQDDDCDGKIDEGFTCKIGEVQTQSCGNCGVRKRTCTGSCTWGGWSGCTSQGVCTPGNKQTTSCEKCGKKTRTCTSSCQWGGYGSCTGKGACSAGSTASCTSGCGTKKCSSSCSYGGCTYTKDSHENNGTKASAKYLGSFTENNAIPWVKGTFHVNNDVDYYKLNVNEVPFSIDTDFGLDAELTGGAGTKTVTIYYDHGCDGSTQKTVTKSGSGTVKVTTGDLENIFFSQNGCMYVRVKTTKWSCSQYTLKLTLF